MKRFSFFVAILCALLVAGMAQAQQGVVSISGVAGLVSGDTIGTGQNVVFHIAFNNNTGQRCDISNGYKIFTPDGATWDSVTIDTIPPNNGNGENWFVLYFDVAFSNHGQLTDLTYSGNDTVGCLGAGSQTKATKQMPTTQNGPVYDITVHMAPGTLTTNDAKHLCIDSAFFGSGGTWKWVGRNLAEFFPTWVGLSGQNHVNGSGYCFYLWNVPNLAPVVVTTGTQCPVASDYAFVVQNLTASHCVAQTYNFDACDKEGDPYTFHLVSGPGAVDAATGVWTANTLATGNYTVVVRADDAKAGTKFGTLNVTATNAAPAFTAGCGTNTITNTGAVKTVQMTATDADGCDPLTYSIVSITPATGATATINASTGLVTFSATAAGAFTVTVGVTDGIITAPVTCDITFQVSAGSLYGVRIEKTHGTLQGMFETVDVLLEGINTDPVLGGIGGFNFLIGYDNSALSLQSVDNTTSPLYTTCKWEYFTYRFGANGNCGSGCPTGLVNVTGMAEFNNGAAHPTCTPKFVGTIPTGGLVMFSMKFLVSNDRTLNCMYVPIRFYWVDCTDNTISNFDGAQLYISGRVFDYHNQDVQLDNALASFPGFYGVPQGVCDTGVFVNGKFKPDRNIDFFDGGVDIICSNDIDARGDINLNKISNEIADAVMFTNYFVYGLTAFGTHIQGSIAASDVNADGLTLTVADLVYMIRTIVGDVLPYQGKLSNPNVNVSVDGNIYSVSSEMGAVAMKVKGNHTPINLTSMNMKYAYDAQSNVTSIIMVPQYALNQGSISGFNGQFIQVDGELVSMELATILGQPVNAKPVPANFGLGQSYPNPFNPTAVIPFSLPVASQYTLTVYNVTGQKVAEFSGTQEAGYHQVTFDGSKLASGIYFYKLNAGSFTATKKMALVK